ncbi:hypothetical protein [Neobacillus sp. FSL H8-0543]|uniref:hypothetical protein n=1 Tax=Neobacillus sp. FSL H8-0543 TaxID=2954672 RepID=UPI0031599161
MEGNEHNEKHKSNREMDPFSRLMLGNRKPREAYQESENNSEELLEQKEQLSFDTRSNHYDNDWFFGRRRKEHVSGNQKRKKQTQNTQSKIENYINNVDIGLLMETFDSLVTTSKQFKPIIKEVAPFFSKITKKFKK